jgi:hypothetical protein
MGTSLWQPPDDKKTTLAAGMLSVLGIFCVACSILKPAVFRECRIAFNTIECIAPRQLIYSIEAICRYFCCANLGYYQINNSLAFQSEITLSSKHISQKQLSSCSEENFPNKILCTLLQFV